MLVPPRDVSRFRLTLVGVAARMVEGMEGVEVESAEGTALRKVVVGVYVAVKLV